jgi:hypothetical protein
MIPDASAAKIFPRPFDIAILTIKRVASFNINQYPFRENGYRTSNSLKSYSEGIS